MLGAFIDFIVTLIFPFRYLYSYKVLEDYCIILKILWRAKTTRLLSYLQTFLFYFLSLCTSRVGLLHAKPFAR